MAPSISPGSAATALSLLILAASNVGMWLRIADVAAAPRDQLSEPEIELTLGQLHGLLAHDNVLNMDARTVISCIDPSTRATRGHSAAEVVGAARDASEAATAMDDPAAKGGRTAEAEPESTMKGAKEVNMEEQKI